MKLKTVVIVICLLINGKYVYSQDDITFKSEAFLEAVLNHKTKIDLNDDGKIQKDEADKVIVLDLMEKNLDNADDIIHFPNVEKISLTINNIEEIKVDGFKHLKQFYCARNKLKELVLKNLPELKDVACGRNYLTQIMIENVPNLESINMMDNQLTSIDLLPYTKLKYLTIDGNKLTEIDFSNNPELVQFNIRKNNIESVDITKNQNLNMKILYLDDTVKIIGTEEQMANYREMPVIITH